MSSKASCKQAPKYLIPKSSFQQYYSRLLHPSEFGRAMDSKTVSSTIDMDRNQTSHRGFTSNYINYVSKFSRKDNMDV